MDRDAPVMPTVGGCVDWRSWRAMPALERQSALRAYLDDAARRIDAKFAALVAEREPDGEYSDE